MQAMVANVAERLNPSFRIVGRQSASDDFNLHLSGPLETQDELDALVHALRLMRQLLTPPPLIDASRVELETRIKRYTLPSQRAAKNKAERQLAELDA